LRIAFIQLRESEQRLKELNATKDRLFSIIGHDLRGPIGGFKSLIQLLISGYDLSNSKQLLEILKVIHKTANSTYDLLENLLEWAKSQQNEIVFNPEKIELKDLVFNIMNLFSEVILNKEINIVNEIPDDQFLVADKNMLSTVLRNLISNAIKFTPNGKSIKISVANIGDNIKISVQDEGTGIQEEDLPKLFNSLSPLSSYGTQGEKGSGLGLLLCKDFIERHTGIIEVNSIWDKGSTFSFTLPQATK